jgi:hypothetical protein
MNTQTQEALNLAIEEIQDLMQHIKDRQPDMLFTGSEYVINACKEALATNKESSLVQPTQEPYAWATEWEDGEWSISHSPNMGKQSIPLYPHSTPDSTPAIEQALGNQEGNKESNQQPAQEPFGIYHVGNTEEESDFFLFKDSGDVSCESCINLYTHPHQDGTSTSEARDKEFVTLTDDEILAIPVGSRLSTARAIEQELKVKNHGRQ